MNQPTILQCNAGENYTYSYSKTGDAPLLSAEIPQQALLNSNLVEMKPGDSSSMRSDWSRSDSPPPEPELIQVVNPFDSFLWLKVDLTILLLCWSWCILTMAIFNDALYILVFLWYCLAISVWALFLTNYFEIKEIDILHYTYLYLW